MITFLLLRVFCFTSKLTSVYFTSHKELKVFNQSQIFALENISQSLHDSCLHSAFALLSISKVKYSNNRSLFQLLIFTIKWSKLRTWTFSEPPPGDAIKTRGLHFIQINVNRALTKIDEFKDNAIKSNPAVIGITESKLDKFILDSEISMDH